MYFRGKIVTPDNGIISDGVVETQGNKIIAVGEADSFSAEIINSIPKNDYMIFPGLIDVHCHGGGGFGFPAADLAGIELAANYHRGRGTTTLVASLVSASLDVLQNRVKLLSEAVDKQYIKGIHLEGPFISITRKGAQDAKDITAGNPAGLEKILKIAPGKVVSMTIAPEVLNFYECIEILHKYQVIPSLGHSVASFTEINNFLDMLSVKDRVTITHLFNGMNPLHHRDPGFITGAIEGAINRKVFLELISDGIHLDSEIVKLMFTICPNDRILFVSDAMEAAGMTDGDYKLGQLYVTVTRGVARLTTADNSEGAIAGGTSDILRQIKIAVEEAKIPLDKAVAAGSAVPAYIYGWDDRGVLAAGKRADILIVDNDFDVISVIAGGEVWK